jgi:hypothetical protein
MLSLFGLDFHLLVPRDKSDLKMFINIERTKALGAGGNVWEKTTEQESFSSKDETSRPCRKFSARLRIIILVCIGFCAGSVWLLNGCFRGQQVQPVEEERPTVTFVELVKEDISSATPAPSPSGVRDVFAVYQPVLTPGGVADDTIEGANSEQTTVLDGASSSSGVYEVVLMEHQFANSYGEPFVGE